MIKIIVVALSALSLAACASLDGVGARLLASDAVLFATSQYVYSKTGVRLSLQDDEEVDIIYRLADSMAARERGEITEEEFAEEVSKLIAEARQ